MATLKEIFREFQPTEALKAGNPRYVDTLSARGIENLRTTLVFQATAGGSPVILFAGSVGDGKTTLLNQLTLDLQAEGAFVVYLDATNYFKPDIAPHDLLPAILEAVMTKLPEAFPGQRGVWDQLLASWKGFWAELRHLGTLPVELEGIEAALPGGVSLVAKLRTRDNAQAQLRQVLQRANEDTLLNLVNRLLASAQQLLDQHQRGRLVVLLDALDRVFAGEATLARDEALFVSGAPFLSRVEVAVVYTARSNFVNQHYQNLGILYGTTPFVLPQVLVRKRNGEPNPEALAVLRRLVERRLEAAGATLEEVFGPGPGGTDRLNRLCLQSGGHMRNLLLLMQNALGAARGQLPLTDEGIRRGIGAIAAPTALSAGSFRRHLERVRETGSLDEVPQEERSHFLDFWYVYRYREDEHDWYGVNPLCIRDAP